MGIFSEIIQSQRNFFYSGNTKNINFRITQLKKLKNTIKKSMPEILTALYLDLKKSKPEAYITEIKVVMAELNYAIHHIKNWSAPKRKLPSIFFPLSRGRIYPEPYGSVLIMSPWNYPFQLTLTPLIGAIAAGNCAVIKPSAYSPNTSAVISKIISKTFEKNFVTVVLGDRKENANLLKEKFDYIFFTGSVSVGKTVMQSASQNLIPVTLELGGKSPCIVDKTANINLTAKRIVMGKFINAGQTCVAPDYLLVDHKIKKKLVALLIKYIHLFYGSNPIDCKWYPKIINEKHFNRLLDLMKCGNIISGGKYSERSLHIEPTLIDNVSWNDCIMKEEIFGPLLPIIEFKNLSEVVSCIQERPKPLALYCFSTNSKIQKFLVKNLSFGGGCINHTLVHLANPRLMFGGVGESGIGQYHGIESFKTFSHYKSLLFF